MTVPDFPTDYVTARDRFRAMAKRLGWSLHAHPISGTGPHGEELTIDTAISTGPTDGRALVVSSGLHGVEGPFGSAVQLGAMAKWLAIGGPPAGVRHIFVHALNPHGYAWGRRVDADNVDPNRNFLLPGQDYSGSPDGYKIFDALLNPRSPPGRFDFFAPQAWLAVLRHGVPGLKQALVAGQYDYPKGIFFGGHGPTATHISLRDRLRGWIGPATDVVHLDFHTGLGPWGSYKLLLDEPPSPEEQCRLDDWFGTGTYEADDPRKTSYLPRGGLGKWCVAQQFAAKYLYLVAEFGTLGNIPMLAALRQENRALHWGRPGQRFVEQAKARLREAFCPASPAWRKRVHADGIDLVTRAALGLASASENRQPNPELL